MRFIASALLASAGLIGFAAFAPTLAGRDTDTHQLTIPLPDGGTETIQYVGGVPPKVSFDNAHFHASPFVAWSAPGFWNMPTFTGLDRVAADMDRWMESLPFHARPLTSAPGGKTLAATVQDLAPGDSAYSVVTQMSGRSVCTRTTRITRRSPDAKPKIVTRASGDCGAAGGLAAAPAGAAMLRAAPQRGGVTLAGLRTGF